MFDLDKYTFCYAFVYWEFTLHSQDKMSLKQPKENREISPLGGEVNQEQCKGGNSYACAVLYLHSPYTVQVWSDMWQQVKDRQM
jgi:hypothetical protein